MIECKFEAIQARSNNVFELATQEEIDKLGATTQGSKSSEKAQFSDDINLDEVKSIWSSLSDVTSFIKITKSSS